MRTLRSRLLRTLTFTMLVLFAAEWLLLSVAIRHVSEQGMLEHLLHDGEALADVLELRGGTVPVLDMRGVEAVYRTPHSGHYYAVRVDGGTPLRSPSLGELALPLQGGGAAQRWNFHAPGPGGQSLLVHGRTRQIEGHVVEIFVAEDISGINGEIWRLSLASLAVFLPLFIGALVLQGIAVGRALRPLVKVRDQLREVGAGRHAQITGDVPQEIGPLVDELNRLLVLLHRRLKQSRSAMGNLAHALKTPLAVLFRTAEDAAVPPLQRGMVQSQAGAIRERLERELRRARLAGPTAGGAGAWFNPAVELPSLARALAAIHGDKPIDIRVDAPDALLPFDREDMLELLGNLADNACKWARGRVVLQVAADTQPGSPLRLAVADDGPGLTPQQQGAVATRGVRLDESKPGHGLGLSIVRDIVDLYGGQLEFGRDPELGGLRVAVVLPPEPAATLPAT